MVLIGLEMMSGYPKYPRDALMKLSSRSNIGKLVKTIPSSKFFPGVLEDRDVLDRAEDGVRVLRIPFGRFRNLVKTLSVN